MGYVGHRELLPLPNFNSGSSFFSFFHPLDTNSNKSLTEKMEEQYLTIVQHNGTTTVHKKIFL